MKRTVFHTVKATEDKDAIIRDAPFLCVDKADELEEKVEWLGDGYYFWETFESLAHWWGKVRYLYRGSDYIICKTIFVCPEEDLLDLVGNTEQIQDIQMMVEEMKKNPVYAAPKYSAQFIINFIRLKTPFHYKAIRAWGRDASRDKSITQHIYYFDNKASIHLNPEIQICVIDRNVLKLPMEICYCSEEDSMDCWTV